MTSSTTPSDLALSRPPAISSCSSASSCSTSARMSSGRSASLRRCRMRTAAIDPITATVAPGPGEHPGGAEGAGVHRDVRAAVGLARDDGDAWDDGLGEGVQQLGAATHDALPLLADAGQVAGDVDDDDERDAERVTHPHEARGLLGRGRVEAAAEAQRVVGDDADRAAAEATEGGDDVGRPALVQLDGGALVEQVLDERVDVVGALGRLRQVLGEVDVVDRRRLASSSPWAPSSVGEGARLGERLLVGLGGDVHDAAAAARGARRLRAAPCRRPRR